MILSTYFSESVKVDCCHFFSFLATSYLSPVFPFLLYPSVSGHHSVFHLHRNFTKIEMVASNGKLTIHLRRLFSKSDHFARAMITRSSWSSTIDNNTAVSSGQLCSHLSQNHIETKKKQNSFWREVVLRRFCTWRNRIENIMLNDFKHH